MDAFQALCEQVVSLAQKQQQQKGARNEELEQALRHAVEEVELRTLLLFCGDGGGVVERAVVPLLRDKYLRGVVTSKALHESASSEALRTVATAMHLAAALCTAFGAEWTVSSAAPAEQESFAVLLVALCTTVLRSHVAGALEATAGSAAVEAVLSCAAVLHHAIDFFTSDDDQDEEGGQEDSAWWQHLRPQTLLGMRQRIVEALVDVGEALAAASPRQTGGEEVACALTRLLGKWLVAEGPTPPGPQQASVLGAVVACFGGAPQLLAHLESVHLDRDMPVALYDELCSVIKSVETKTKKD